jgi:hypothetical protein
MHTIAIPPNQHFYAGAIRALELSHESWQRKILLIIDILSFHFRY